MWNKSPISGRPKQEKAKQEILENLLEENYDLNVQFHKLKRESIFCFAVAHYDEKLPFKEWEKKHYGNYIEQPKQETTSQETIEQIVNSLSIKDATNLDLFLKGIQHQKEQEGNKYTEDEFLEFSQWVSNEDWVYLPSKGYWVNEEQEELEQKLTTKELFDQFKRNRS